MHSPQILDTLIGILINLNATPGAFSTGTWTKKDGIYRDYSIVTPDAFSTGIAQRKMVSIAIKSISLLMHSQLGLHKERWYLYSIEIAQLSLLMHSSLGLDKE